MSAFRKYTPLAAAGGTSGKKALAGTKSWLYGQSLLSTGCSDLNNACGSGIPLGSIVIVSEDSFIHQGKSLAKLFAAEGIHSKQKVLLISSLSETDIHEWCAKLPCLRETQQSAMESKGDAQQRMPMERAWQYSQYLSQTGSTIVSSCLKRRKERSHGVLPRV